MLLLLLLLLLLLVCLLFVDVSAAAACSGFPHCRPMRPPLQHLRPFSFVQELPPP
jgi:hypothetical protein